MESVSVYTKVAGVDVHKKMLAVVVIEGEAERWRGKFGTSTAELERLRDWLLELGVAQAVMESTAQYWRPVWQTLEPCGLRLHLAQARSNRGPRGRKNDYGDAQRLARRFLAGDLILSYVPDAEQRVWRRLSRTRQQLTQERSVIQNQIESLLPEGGIQLSGVISVCWE